jgi:hypothetical protein
VDREGSLPRPGVSSSERLEERLATVEARLRAVADELEITRLVASYGPWVDSGRAEEVASLWEADGVYDVDELVMRGREQVAAMVRSTQHRGWIEGGCAHLVLPPRVRVTGDEAVAVGHSVMVVRQDGRFVVRRATANHWRLRRGPHGWRVAARTSRVLDGRPDAPALLAADLEAARPEGAG